MSEQFRPDIDCEAKNATCGEFTELLDEEVAVAFLIIVCKL